MIRLFSVENGHKQLIQQNIDIKQPNVDNTDYVRMTFRNPLKHRSQGLSVLASVRKIIKLDPAEISGTVRCVDNN